MSMELSELQPPDYFETLDGHEKNLKTCSSEEPLSLAPGIALRPYQLQGSLFLQHGSRGLFDAVGLGKTIQVLHASQALRARKILVLCPKSLIIQWESEIKKFYPGAVIYRAPKHPSERKEFYTKYQKGFVILSYEMARIDMDYVSRIYWDVTIADEAIRLGNSRIQLHKKMEKLRSKYRWALTGTPISNSLVDAHGIFSWLQPDLLGRRWQFEDRYCRKNYWGAIIGYMNVDELKRIIGKFYIRRTAEDVLPELPDKVVNDIAVELSESEKELYKAIKQEIYHELTGGKADKISLASLGSALTQIVRLQQVTGHASLIGTGHKNFSKFEALRDKLKAILSEDSTDKVIVFTKFKQMAKLLESELSEHRPLIIHGDCSQKHRADAVKLLNESPEHRLLIGTDALSEGLNIQGANHVIMYDFSWSIAKYVQKVGRAYRLGQKKTVFIWNLICEATIDEYIIKRLGKKHDLSATLITETSADIQDEGLTIEDVEEILK